MPSKSLTLKLSPDLDEVIDLRWRQLGYPSKSAYIKSLARYDALVQGSHPVTVPIAQKPLMEQDAIDANLLAATKQGKGSRGVLLKRLLVEAGLDPAKVADLLK